SCALAVTVASTTTTARTWIRWCITASYHRGRQTYSVVKEPARASRTTLRFLLQPRPQYLPRPLRLRAQPRRQRRSPAVRRSPGWRDAFRTTPHVHERHCAEDRARRPRPAHRHRDQPTPPSDAGQRRLFVPPDRWP